MSVRLALTGDKIMGLAGGCLAVASAGFGAYMTMRGPSADFGKSKDFTIFAQLAPRAPGDVATTVPDRPVAANPATLASTQDLDLTATATIPKPAELGTANTVIPLLSVEVATGTTATIRIDGRVRTVHVGDNVPGVGDVLSINPGVHPTVRTTRGMIISRDDD